MKNRDKHIDLDASPGSKPLIYADHHPVTRRQFLSQGFITFSAVSTLPGVLGLGARTALADCGATGRENLAFLAFDMAGGAGLPGNFLVGKKGGPENLLESYDKLGWDPRRSGALFKDFGLPMSTSYSKMLTGILANTSPEARANLRMGSLCHFAQDDSSSNRLHASSLILASGSFGEYIGNGLGIVNSESGGNSSQAFSNLALKPTVVGSVDQIISAASVAGTGQMSRAQVLSMVKGTSRLGRIQGDSIRGRPNGGALADLASCAYDKAISFVDGAGRLDPRGDEVAAAVYGINANTNSNDMNAVAAGIAMCSLRGFSGPGIWTLGGCDYHDGTQTTGDGKDLDMGNQIGRAVELAHRLKKPLFFQLLTDGGVASENGSRQWRSDAGEKCMTVCGFYHPDGPAEMQRLQVGHYTDGQGAERSTMIGANPQLVACAVFANYLAVSGQLQKFHEYLPNVFAGAGELESILLFKERA